jgi:hypothetical protein
MINYGYCEVQITGTTAGYDLRNHQQIRRLNLLIIKRTRKNVYEFKETIDISEEQHQKLMKSLIDKKCFDYRVAKRIKKGFK